MEKAVNAVSCDHTAVITSEYNTVHVVEWLRKHTPIAEMKKF